MRAQDVCAIFGKWIVTAGSEYSIDDVINQRPVSFRSSICIKDCEYKELIWNWMCIFGCVLLYYWCLERIVRNWTLLFILLFIYIYKCIRTITKLDRQLHSITFRCVQVSFRLISIPYKIEPRPKHVFTNSVSLVKLVVLWRYLVC